MKIPLNPTTSLDLDRLIESRALVQANSGGGKSWILRRILEQSHGKVQQIIIDPEGEFSTLREKFDYIYAGKGGDVPADTRVAGKLAERLLEIGVSAIVDLYELPPQERKHFVRLFLDAMVNAPKELWHPVVVVLDEAHVFAPEKEQSEAQGSVIDMASRGRKRGFCLIAATQRPAKLNKDVAAECNNKLIGRASLDIDRKRSAEELGFTSREEVLSLRNLDPGQFYAFGPAISRDVELITVGAVQTTHPKIGSRSVASKIAKPSDAIKKILGQIADLPKEAAEEARTVADLRKENANLKRELTVASKKRDIQPTKIERIEVPTVGKRALEGLKEAETKWRMTAKSMKAYGEMVEKAADKLAGELAKVTAQAPVRATPATISMPSRVLAHTKPTNAVQTPVEGITGPERRILNAIAWLESIGVPEPEQPSVAFLAGYTYGGGGFNNPKGALRTKGLIEYRGGNLVLTEAGRAAAEIPDTPLTTQALHEAVLARLPGPEQRILKPLLAAYPDPMSYEDLASASGYALGAGGFNNPRGRLRTLGLIEYLNGESAKARDILFIN